MNFRGDLFELSIVHCRNDLVTLPKLQGLVLEFVGIIVTGEMEFSHRMQMLIVLQENSSSLLTSDDRLEVAVCSLSNYCEQLKSVNNFFKSQILATITTMLINYINPMTETFATLLSRHCDQLWQIFEVVNNKENCLLREIAVECLVEIEESFPCIFLSKLDEISITCFKENLYPFQNYSNLLSYVLKNMTTISKEIRTNKLLVSMKKLLLMDVSKIEISRFHAIAYLKLFVDINHYAPISKVSAIVAKLLDFVPLSSTTSVYYIISNIVRLIKVFNLNPLILKTFIHRHMLTSDTILFYTLLKLKDTFEIDLLSHSEQDSMMKILIDKCNPISSSEANRMLALTYMTQYLDKQKLNLAGNKFVFESNFYLLQPLDNLRVKESKLEVFTKLLPYFKDKDWHNREFLESISGIYSQLSRDSHGHYIISLCRILFHSILSQNESILETEYQRISLSVMKHYPQFSMHVLHFMKKINVANPTSMFFNHVLSTAVHHVTNLPFGHVQHQLHDYLLFLSEAALENSEYSQPKAIIRFLQKVLNENAHNPRLNLSWLLGHALLNVCKHVLCFHNSNNIFADLSEVLHTIMSQNHDIDVCDRAQFYYMLLTTLSPKKISTMFQQNIHKSRSCSAFTSFVPGDTAYGIPAPVIHLKQSIFGLTCSPTQEQDSSICDKITENVDVNDYLQWLTETGYSWKTILQCRLSIVTSTDDCMCNDIYGTILSFVGPPFCAEIPRISVLHLARGKRHTFSLEVQTVEPRQLQISVSAVFSASNGQTCYCQLEPLLLEFHDLFQPLPVPFEYVTRAQIWRKNLANSLWIIFTSMAVSCDYHQSVVYLLIEEHIYHQLLNKELKSFVTESTTNCSQTSATVGIFLPQRSHLIMRIRYDANEGMIVHMATDQRHILAQANLYFLKLENLFNKSVEQ